MTNDGGRPYEPTSYHLQEPQNAAQAPQAPHAQHTPQQDVPTYQMPPAQPAPQRQTQPDPGAVG
ncbi:hypothetical protein [Streptomyces nanshensis]|uniref:hypothetical protein n=1 Tax=Streptomyces nanshensis TaxID=518642 RepID=UPI002693016B